MVARRMRDFDPSLVLTNSAIGLHPVIARRFFCKWKGPIVATWDDFYEVIWRLNYGRLAGLFMKWFERQIIVHSDYIITISRYNQKRAEGWGKKTWYIPNGCDVPEYDVSACRTRLAGAMKLVYVGDQGRYKRTEDIVRAMKHVPPDIKLYLVGNPNPTLIPYASENVIFLGRLTENDKWSVMSQADVLVCTADTDCNAKFHEYLRMGKPILGYDGIPNHLFTNRRNAILTRDYPAAIMELFKSPDLRRLLADNAARDIPVYTWKEIAQRYDHAFAELLGLCGHVRRGRGEEH
jgi:glycosyltransferase involved in cell wall biosynthesis